MLILGIDPGTATTGYGIVQKVGETPKLVTYGTILTKPKDAAADRLVQIYDKVCALIDTYQPDVMVIERLFFGKNETAAMAVGRASGVVLLAAAQRDLEIVDYKPMEVKQSVVGYGGAEKKQVQYMVARILQLKDIPKPDDAADALALCITHAHSSKLRSLQPDSGHKGGRKAGVRGRGTGVGDSASTKTEP